MTTTLTTKLDWTYTDFFTVADGTRYLNNIKAVRQALNVLSTTPQVPATMSKLTYKKANDIEQILVDIEQLVVSMENYFVYSGVSNSGQSRFWQNRFRHFYSVETSTYNPRRLSYLESSGTQYINLGMQGSNNTKFIVDFEPTEITTTTSHLLGSVTNNTRAITFNVSSSTSSVSRWGNQSITGSWGIEANKRYLIEVSEAGYFINGNQVWSPTANTFTTGYNMLLFATYNSANRFKGKIYSCKVYEGGTLARDLVPALDDDGVACMLDKAHNTYFRNVGTGTFTAGTSFQAVEYLESTGTQFIDTGVNVDANLQTNIEFAMAEVSTTTSSYLFGCSGTRRYYVGQHSGGAWWCASSSNEYLQFGTADTSKHNAVYNDYNKNIIFDGTTIAQTKAFYTVSSCFGFSENNGSGRPLNLNTKQRIYSLKLSHRTNGTVYRDLIPALDSNGEPCFFDTVSNGYFYNMGLGTFNYA